MTEATIRAYRPGDLDAVVRLGLRAWAPVFAAQRRLLGEHLFELNWADWAAIQEEEIRSVCTTHDDHTLIAEVEGAVVGYGTVVIIPAGQFTAKKGVVEMLAVDPDAQRAGIGRALLDSCLAMTRAADCKVVYIGTGGDPGHAPARALYESAGLVPLPGVHYFMALDPPAPEATNPSGQPA